ncbi:SOUL family heme-binding protein [Sphingomicrobium lutaoense]|uniref:SOUL heme-binding protein n=1 Tax=Sphingomicrobium lutaoense TaxID=515949 RepID=A0A839Z2Q9_9SPHN|nr:heme-binding protein [Sphingomicrobium lutaoense]MBB3764838.1 hypothetical protein [Sphingomicrobium lutaoense]
MKRRGKWLLGGGLLLGLTLAGGARYLLRERATPEPDYLLVEKEGDFEIRDYLPMWVAETVCSGSRREAIRAGFRTLADYIFARSHDGDSLPMTAPVIERQASEDHWTVRFVMPEGESVKTLPRPPADVELRHVEARRIALVRFSGRPEEYDLEAEEKRLREWLGTREEEILFDTPEYAFFNSPAMPGPLRRNELWFELALDPPAAN